jgi:hypothetical protein
MTRLPARARVAPRRRWAPPAIGALLAAAAAMLLVQRLALHPAAPPEYELAVEGAASQERGPGAAPSPVARVARGGRLVLVARPKAPAKTRLEAAAWIEAPPGSFARWPVAVRTSEEGAFRLDADPGALASLPSGRCRLVVFVGAPDRMPGDAGAAARAAAGGQPDVEALVQELDVDPAPPAP